MTSHLTNLRPKVKGLASYRSKTKPDKPPETDGKSPVRLGKATYDKLMDKMLESAGVGLGSLVSNLHDHIIADLKKGNSTRDGILNEVGLFVKSEPSEPKTSKQSKAPKECTIDDCIRWNLLLQSVNIRTGNPDEAEFRIDLSKTILEQKPYLAFENPYKGTTEHKKAYRDQCTNHTQHGNWKDESTPFRVAAKCGNHKVIAAMISCGKEFYESRSTERPIRPQYSSAGSYWPLREIVQHKSESSSPRVLLLAMQAREGSDETLEKLLEVEDIVPYNEDGQEDTTFEKAIKEGRLKAVEKFLSRPKLVAAFSTQTYILKALTTQTNRLDILQRLVSGVKGSDTINHEVVEKMVSGDLDEVWCYIPQDALSPDVKACLLHLAVKYQKPKFVEIFLGRYPESVRQKQAVGGEEKEQYPLWYNNHSNAISELSASDAEVVKKAIRTDIVNKMIHEVSEIEILTDIFYESDEPVGDLCFDMSGFHSASYRVSDFVDALIRQSRSQPLLYYEQTLRYAEFPSLDMLVEERETFKENSYLRCDHTEVFKILNWLKSRGVHTIIDLKIPDRMVNPHDDMKMASYVDQFKVESLDWKVLDLSISVLEKGTKDRIKELYLYSSGNRAVISHWFSRDGIASLKKLERLEIKIVQETCTSKRCSTVIKEIRRDFQKFKSSLPTTSNNRPPRNPKIGKVEPVPWFPTPQLADLSQIAHRIAPKLARWLLTTLRPIVAAKKRMGQAHKPTKVAILDNGILSISPVSHSNEEDETHDKGAPAQVGNGKHWDKTYGPSNGTLGSSSSAVDEESQDDDSRTLWKRIKEGRSFVDGHNRLSPWSFASNPHGTQMANLICAIDPFCELYVARVAEDAMGITSKRVAQAINWATDREVDVISMSFIIGEDKDDHMKKAIQKAEECGIMMTCSAHDEGSRIAKAWPAAYHTLSDSLIVLAACDGYGKILREADDRTYNYLIEGQDVPAGVIPFLKSEDTITGSSVSTALAAGLSSLILTCDRLADPDKQYDKGSKAGSRSDLIRERLDRMKAPNSKFVLLENYNHIADLINSYYIV